MRAKGLRQSVLSVFLVFLLISAGAVSDLCAQTADQLYGGGRQAFSDKLWPAAASQFSRLIREYPEDLRADSAAYMAAVAYYNAGSYKQSINILAKFPRQYPNSAWNQRAAYWEGMSFYQLKQWAQAESAFERQAAISSDKIYQERALLYLGACRENLNKKEQAESVYEKLVRESRDYETVSQALFRLGQIQLSLERYGEALASFRRILADYTGSDSAADSGYWIGETLRRLGRREEALNVFRSFLESVYTSEYRAAALLEAANLASRTGECEEALAYLDLRNAEMREENPSGISSDPNRSAVMRIRAACALKTGRLEEARSAYMEVLEKPVSEQEAQSAAFNLAQTWLGTPQALEALPYLKQASEGPDQLIAGDASFESAQLLLVSKNPQGSVQLQAFISAFPEHPRREEALRGLVRAHQEAKNSGGALKALNTLIEDYPESGEIPAYRFLRAEIQLQNGNQGAALKDYKQLTEQFKGTAEASDAFSRIGFIFTERGEHMRAAAYYEKAAAQFSAANRSEKKRQAVYSAGVAYLNGRATEKAVEKFRYLIDTDPGGPWGVEAAYHMGEAFYDAKQYESARRAYETAARYGDKNWAFEAAYATGWTWFRQSKWKEAARAFQKAAQIAPGSEKKARSRYRTGLSLASDLQWEKALAEYNEALKAGKTSWREEALYQKAWAFLNLGDREEAFRTAGILEREYPSSGLPADLPFRMGENAMKQQAYAQAVEWFSLCSSKYPNSATGIQSALRAAHASRKNGNIEDAALRYGRWVSAHTREPGAGAAARSWAEVLREAGNPQLADNAKNKVLSFKPSRPDVVVPVMLAWARVNGIPDEAAPYLDSYADNERLPVSDRAEALLLRAHLYRKNAKYSRSRQIYEVLIRDISGPRGAEAQEGLARSYAEEGKINQAIEAYLELPYLFPEEPYYISRSLRAAEKLYRDAGKDNEADELRKRLNEEVR
ncbi:MAG: hypothetical protein CSA76_03930 [Spirochaetales bacterium]|nr:MAG: hypothetical protein CSA76_03930 [Spirochaetales bacterium]